MEQNLYSMSTTELGKYAKVFFIDRLKTLRVNLIDYELKDAYICAKLGDKLYKFKVKSARI